MEKLSIEVGDMDAFKASMDKLGVIKTQENYHEPVFALSGLDVFFHPAVPKDEAWLVNKDGKPLQKYKL